MDTHVHLYEHSSVMLQTKDFVVVIQNSLAKSSHHQIV